MPNDEHETALLQDFTRLDSEGASLQAAVVEWTSSHTPTLRWHVFQTWGRSPEPDELEEAKQRALNDARFFRTCTTCRVLHNVGHMHDDHLCQACAEQHHGVIY